MGFFDEGFAPDTSMPDMNSRTKKLLQIEELYKIAKRNLDYLPSTINKKDGEDIIFSSFFFEIQNILND